MFQENNLVKKFLKKSFNSHYFLALVLTVLLNIIKIFHNGFDCVSRNSTLQGDFNPMHKLSGSVWLPLLQFLLSTAPRPTEKNYLETVHHKDVDGGNKSLKQDFSLHFTWLSWSIDNLLPQNLRKKSKEKVMINLDAYNMGVRSRYKSASLEYAFLFFPSVHFKFFKRLPLFLLFDS